MQPLDLTAEALLRLGEWRESSEPGLAMEYYRAALRVEPTCALAAFRAGKLAIGERRFVEAVTLLENAAALSPGHAPTYQALAAAYAGLGEPARALEWCDRVLELAPQNPGAQLRKLRLLAELERWDELLVSPADAAAAEVRLLRSLALVHLGRDEEARAIWDRAPRSARQRFRDLAGRLAGLLSENVPDKPDES